MTKKSSLKTFLKGENPFTGTDSSCPMLKGSQMLISVVGFFESGNNSVQTLDPPEQSWFCDVLDDGTAITYYAY
jgi:hypothetical protein